MRRVPLAVALLSALMLLGACGSATSSPTTTGTPSVTGSATRLCQALTAASGPITSLTQVGSGTTVGELRASQQKLASALDTVAKLPGSRGDAYNSLKSFSDQLASQLQGLPDSATLGDESDKLQNVQDKATQAQSSLNKLSSTAGCNG